MNTKRMNTKRINITTIEKQHIPTHIVPNKDGILSALEFTHLPFKPRRILYVCDVNKGEIRGEHAHYINEQIILCIRGEILVKLWDGIQSKEFHLSKDEYVYVPPMVWDSQQYLTGDDIMLSIHSMPHVPEDKISNINVFLKEKIKEQLAEQESTNENN